VLVRNTPRGSPSPSHRQGAWRPARAQRWCPATTRKPPDAVHS